MGRRGDQQISIADLTGVAVQDLVIAMCVYEKAREQLER
jgi:ornithine cyclodeaminase/alanine dehydrogenase-like protein (mu-crystallin family)